MSKLASEERFPPPCSIGLFDTLLSKDWVSDLNARKKRPLDAASLVQKRPRRRVVRIVLVIFLVILLLVTAVIGGVGIYFSNAILQVIHYTPVYTLAVTDVSPKTLTLQRTSDTQTP